MEAAPGDGPPQRPGGGGRKPAWIRSGIPSGPVHARVRSLVRELDLDTVCQSALCPNLAECWGEGTATFLILGARCTRGCAFCAVDKGEPAPADPDEPERVARAVARLGLRHAVVTSVTRDDMEDGGASQFALTIEAIRRTSAGCTVEVLVPDFRGSLAALDRVLAARPDVLNHNVETVPRLYPLVRPGADYERSLVLLRVAARAGPVSKSGLMVGLGERREEIRSVLGDLAAAGCRHITIGQYLRPSRRHLDVARYVPPEEFEQMRAEAIALGFPRADAGPLVRSSYHAAPRHAGGP